jgi:carbonic anhydrase/acetyltransferase-like protein (isoleucine patch superfamily)
MSAAVEGVPAHVDAQPDVADTAFVASNAIVIGDVIIGPDASVWFGCVVRGDVQRICIGARSNIQDGTVIHATTNGQQTVIGEGVTVGHAAVLHSCTLEDGAFVGIGAHVLDRAVVKAGGMLAAGAVLTPDKIVPSGELWAGSPARPLRKLSAAEQEGMIMNAHRYVALARRYRLQHPSIYKRSDKA